MKQIKNISFIFILLSAAHLFSNDFFINGESVHGSISEFLNSIDSNNEFVISTKDINGDRDNFSISGLKISNKFLNEELISINEINCSGYKVNDYEFNVSLSKYFKIAKFEDVNRSLKTPKNCYVDKLKLTFLEKLAEPKNSLSTDKQQNQSTELNKFIVNLLSNIDFNISSYLNESGYNNEMLISLNDQIFFNIQNTYATEIKKIHTFLDTFFYNVVFNYWGYQSYQELYKDISEDTSEIYLDFLADFQSNPGSYQGSMPLPFPEVLLKSFSVDFSWTEDDYKTIKKIAPELDLYIVMLKAFTFQKMSKEQFLQSINELVPSGEDDSSTNIVQDNLYKLYISFINAIEEFSDNPLGFEIVIQSSEGINVSPDLAQLFQSTSSEENLGLEHYYNIAVMQFLSNLLASENSSIVINANPDTK